MTHGGTQLPKIRQQTWAHRIGQTHTVTVYKLIARHTIEEKILELQENKKALSDQILSEEGVTASQLTKEELLKLLQN